MELLNQISLPEFQYTSVDGLNKLKTVGGFIWKYAEG